MSKEKFVSTIDYYQNFLDKADKLEALGINLYDGPLVESIDFVFDAWINEITGEAGSELIYWWLFEDVEKKIYEDDKVIADLKDEEALYIYMKENGHFETEGNS